ncbi:hypothetical protein BC834DRAFT_847848 [Gloeopeniophorella convolvens]|nr:hypothetical protein BC834DRAFT_847848 [Gloeopeniophorella convolvens]
MHSTTVVGSGKWLEGMELAREKVAMARALDPASTLLAHSPTYPTPQSQKWPRMPSLSALEVLNLSIAGCPAFDKISPDTASDEVKVFVYEPEEVPGDQYEDGTAPSPNDVEIAPSDPSPRDFEESRELCDDPSYPLEGDLDEPCGCDGATASKGPSSRDQIEIPDEWTCDSDDDGAVASSGPLSCDLDKISGACDEDWEDKKPDGPCDSDVETFDQSCPPSLGTLFLITPTATYAIPLTPPIAPILCAFLLVTDHLPGSSTFHPPYAFSLTSFPCINSPRTASRALSPAQVIYPHHISGTPDAPTLSARAVCITCYNLLSFADQGGRARTLHATAEDIPAPRGTPPLLSPLLCPHRTFLAFSLLAYNPMHDKCHYQTVRRPNWRSPSTNIGRCDPALARLLNEDAGSAAACPVDAAAQSERGRVIQRSCGKPGTVYTNGRHRLFHDRNSATRRQLHTRSRGHAKLAMIAGALGHATRQMHNAFHDSQMQGVQPGVSLRNLTS